MTLDVAGTDALHLIHIPVDPRKLLVFAHAQGLAVNGEMDEGYAVHALLLALFGDAAPKPFTVRRPPRGGIVIVGYAAEGAEALSDMAALVAEPAAHAAVAWDGVAGKRMPARFGTGMRVGFEVRACPICRISGSSGGRDPKSEIDVAERVLEQWAETDGVPKPTRDAIYQDWIGRELGRGGAGRLLSFSLDAFRIQRIMRRTHQEVRRKVDSLKPDAVMSGTMEILDAAGFSMLLRRGVGRHRSFGYGALLLRPLQTRG